MKSCYYSKYGKPETLLLDSSRPKPVIKSDDEVLVAIHAASINFIDLLRASGGFKPFDKRRPPSGIGYDLAGVVESVGKGVTDFRQGDQVWACLLEPQVPQGTWSEYIVMPQSLLGHKPKNISFVQAAAMPMVAGTALASLERWSSDDLQGKTVLVTSGLSGVGSMGCQMAKNVFGASKVITTVSTGKVAEVDKLMPGVVDQVIDYRKEDLLDVVAHGSVYHLLDVTSQAMALRPLLRRGGHIGTVTNLPTSADMKQLFGYPIPMPARWFLDSANSIARWRASRYGVEYAWCAQYSSRRDLDLFKEWVEAGKVKPVVGKVVPFELTAIIEASQPILAGKGTVVGKTVIEIVKS